MSSHSVEKHIRDLSLLLDMLDPPDSAGVGAALEICKSIKSDSESIDVLKEINAKSQTILLISENESLEHIVNELKNLVTEGSQAVEQIQSEELALEGTSANIKKEHSSYKITAELSLLEDFIIEAGEHLEIVEGLLLKPNHNFSSEDIDTIFRAIHSIKGTASYFNLHEVEELSHTAESLLDQVRSGSKQLTPTLTSIYLRYVDIIKALLNRAKQSVINKCEVTYFEEAASLQEEIENSSSHEQAEIISLKNKEVLLEEEQHETSHEEQSYIKINLKHLSDLQEHVANLMSSSSKLHTLCEEKRISDHEICAISNRIKSKTKELQNLSVEMRLVPVKGLFQRLARLAWDAGEKLGKKIDFIHEGDEIEIDRGVLEGLGDPLMHMVRNAIDHGIESPQIRASSGKSDTGVVRILAEKKGRSIRITISDDGRGIDPEAILKKAMHQKLVDATEKLTRHEKIQLIFLPGFSTVDQASEISGRGVGMDVVKTNVEAMRGRVAIESSLGSGSTFTIELPLTLATVDGFDVVVGDHHFVLPLLAATKIIDISSGVEIKELAGARVILFQEKLIPIASLKEVFQIESEESEEKFAILLDSGKNQLAVLVDDICGMCSGVVSSISNTISMPSAVIGSSSLENGEFGLVLDQKLLIQEINTYLSDSK